MSRQHPHQHDHPNHHHIRGGDRRNFNQESSGFFVDEDDERRSNRKKEEVLKNIERARKRREEEENKYKYGQQNDYSRSQDRYSPVHQQRSQHHSGHRQEREQQNKRPEKSSSFGKFDVISNGGGSGGTLAQGLVKGSSPNNKYESSDSSPPPPQNPDSQPPLANYNSYQPQPQPPTQPGRFKRHGGELVPSSQAARKSPQKEKEEAEKQAQARLENNKPKDFVALFRTQEPQQPPQHPQGRIHDMRQSSEKELSSVDHDHMGGSGFSADESSDSISISSYEKEQQKQHMLQQQQHHEEDMGYGRNRNRGPPQQGQGRAEEVNMRDNKNKGSNNRNRNSYHENDNASGRGNNSKGESQQQRDRGDRRDKRGSESNKDRDPQQISRQDRDPNNAKSGRANKSQQNANAPGGNQQPKERPQQDKKSRNERDTQKGGQQQTDRNQRQQQLQRGGNKRTDKSDEDFEDVNMEGADRPSAKNNKQQQQQNHQVQPQQLSQEMPPSDEMMKTDDGNGWFLPRGQPSRRGRGGAAKAPSTRQPRMNEFGGEFNEQDIPSDGSNEEHNLDRNRDGSKRGGRANANTGKSGERRQQDRKNKRNGDFDGQDVPLTQDGDKEKQRHRGERDNRDGGNKYGPRDEFNKRGGMDRDRNDRDRERQKNNQFERRANKLPPRLAKQREQNRMAQKTGVMGGQMPAGNNSGWGQGPADMMDKQGSYNNWNKGDNYTTEDLSNMLDQLGTGPQEHNVQHIALEHQQQMMKAEQGMGNDQGNHPVQTIIFENTNFKGGRGDKSGPAPGGPQGYGKHDMQVKDQQGIHIGSGLAFGKPEDSADLKLDFSNFETEMSPVDDKITGSPKTGPNLVSSGHPADDLNMKIASVKKVWETLPNMAAIADAAAAGFAGSFQQQQEDTNGDVADHGRPDGPGWL